MNHFLITLLVAVAAIALATASEDLKIDVTYLPDECEEKSKAGDHMYMHYTGSIDESSETGEKGKVFDSSVSRGTPFDLYVLCCALTVAAVVVAA